MPAKVAAKQRNAGKGKPVAGIEKKKKNKKDSPSKTSAKKKNVKVLAGVEESDSDLGSDLGSDIPDLDSEDEHLEDEVTSDDDEQSEAVTTHKQKTKTTKVKKSPQQVQEIVSEEIPRDHPEKTIFVGNLPKDIEKKFLQKMFSDYGKISTLRLRSAPVADTRVPKKVAVIRKDFHADRTNINAYIVFTTEEGAKRSLEANGTTVEGRHIRVSMLKNTDVDARKAVFLGNVPFGADEEQIHGIFESCGKITSVRIVRHSDQGIGKGFAYVNFETSEAVELALLKNGTELDKRPLRVQRCEPQAAGKKSAPKPGKKQRSKKGKSGSPNEGRQKLNKGNTGVPYEGQKTADKGKVQKKKRHTKTNPKKKAAVETLTKSMAKAGKKNKKQA